MREIKFRAWDKSRLRMYQDPAVHTDGIQWELDNYFSLNSVFLQESHLEFMQYTGLKDKNGVGIFIGDILKLDLLAGDLFSEVDMCPFREIPVVFYFKEHRWEPLHIYVGKPDTCLEVVGNIYENPELLEK